jgi:hypothetical protein
MRNEQRLPPADVVNWNTGQFMDKEKGFGVFIIESSYPKDFYNQQLDGIAAQSLLNILRIPNRFRVVLDLKYLRKALREAAKDDEFDVIHLSCHGGEDGIVLADDSPVKWPQFASLFDEADCAPSALVMSSCCGAAGGIGHAFQSVEAGPGIIFGSKDERSYGEYAAAWALLYHRFQVAGVTKDAAQEALRQINATIGDTFVYRRWDSSKKKFLSYPRQGIKYAVREIADG